MKEDEVLKIALIGGAALAAIYYLKGGSYQNKIETLESIGARPPNEAELKRGWIAGSSAEILQSGGTTYFFNTMDVNNLNLAQQVLLKLPFIPNSWILNGWKYER